MIIFFIHYYTRSVYAYMNFFVFFVDVPPIPSTSKYIFELTVELLSDAGNRPWWIFLAKWHEMKETQVLCGILDRQKVDVSYGMR